MYKGYSHNAAGEISGNNGHEVLNETKFPHAFSYLRKYSSDLGGVLKHVEFV